MGQDNDEPKLAPEEDSPTHVTRRSFVKASAGLAAAVGAVSAMPTAAAAAAARGEHPVFGDDRDDRQRSARRLRVDAARAYESFPENGPDVQPTNGDEARYDDLRGSFSKTLRHDSLGEVRFSSYRSFLRALDSGDPEDFEQIIVGRRNDPNRVRLVSPQAAYSYELFGLDGNDARMPAAPAFASAETAAEMGELYWYALTRDVPFLEYETSALIDDAVSDLNGFSRSDIFTADRSRLTPDRIFRGTLPGAEIGPFVSQFLVQPFQFGRLEVEARYTPPVAGGVNDFMTRFQNYRRIQQGAAPSASTTLASGKRFIATMRDLAEFVHADLPIQSGLYAALILLGYGDEAAAPNNPYLDSRTQQGFVNFGPADITHVVTHGPRLGLTGAWYQKWLAHRRLRPEVFAARINVQLRGLRWYDIHSDILFSGALGRIIAATPSGSESDYGLLPMGYPEGSPAHPAYPGGHSTFVAAAATLLKAWFDEDFEIPNPVMANADGSALIPWTGESLTVGNELNKLVTNITHGRDGAGMHYRSDGRGNYIGERQALGILMDYSRTFNDSFDGFELTLFDGRRARIRDGKLRIS